jgi:hypothetical protein
MKIIFTNTVSFDGLERPQPAYKLVPEWYKKTDSYIGKTKKPPSKGSTDATIKRCMPVFDAIISGYIITLPADVYVSLVEQHPYDSETGKRIEDIPSKKVQYFQWSNLGLVSFHPIEQAPLHPAKNEYSYPKWINPWSIKTPKGYSTLFIQPMHRESVFTILPGIVDTDKYSSPVNFPFVINDPNFEGLIPKGTPIAQVIPFKRDDWEMEFGKDKEFKEQLETTNMLSTVFFDGYKSMFRTTKEYK